MAGYFVNEKPDVIDLLNTPPQVGEWMSRTLNLRIIVEKASFPNGLVNTLEADSMMKKVFKKEQKTKG